MASYRDTPIGCYVVDSQHYDQLSNYESQIKYQAELLTCFFNQESDFDYQKEMSPATNRVKIETRSMTNFTSDDDSNPFLTFLKAKTDKILPTKVTKRQAMELWTSYKKTINKVLPTIRSHINSKKCNLRVLMDLVSNFVAGQGSTVKEIVRNMDVVVDFSVKYMTLYYQTEALSNQTVDLQEVFRFGAYQILFKDEAINSRLNNAVHNESFAPSRLVNTKYIEIIAALKQIPTVRKYLEKTDSQEKAEKIALINEKKSNRSFI